MNGLTRRLLVFVGFALGGAATAFAQQPPPIGGVTGTIALESTVKKEYDGTNKLVVAAVDGTEHILHFAKDLLVHGGNATGEDALRGLRAGETVVVHYTGTGANETAHEIDRVGGPGLKVSEGTITRVDRARKQITIRFDSGATETLQLTDRAATDVGKDVDRSPMGTTRVAVYYSDESGRRVVHFFKKK